MALNVEESVLFPPSQDLSSSTHHSSSLGEVHQPKAFSQVSRPNTAHERPAWSPHAFAITCHKITRHVHIHTVDSHFPQRERAAPFPEDSGTMYMYTMSPFNTV
jgi:hypothetical protein